MATIAEPEEDWNLFEDDFASRMFVDDAYLKNANEPGTKSSDDEDKTTHDNDNSLNDDNDIITPSADNEDNTREVNSNEDTKRSLNGDSEYSDEEDLFNLFEETPDWMTAKTKTTQSVQDSVKDADVVNERGDSDDLSFGLFDTDSESEDDGIREMDNRTTVEETRDTAQRNKHITRSVVAKAMLTPNPWRPTALERAISEDSLCCICLDRFENPKTLSKCSHRFCTECIDQHFKVKPVCPMCFTVYGIITGTQPADGTMKHHVTKCRLPGYSDCQCIVIQYSFEDGTQTEEHPYPGKRYYGTGRTAYLPDNAEGRKVLRLLQEGFKRRLVFTVGMSRTTGADNQVTWNDIHHKTSTTGGQESFGYPDPTYLSRVQEELAAFGVTEESLRERPMGMYKKFCGSGN